ncbi:Beta-galactosidase C-terminal domain [Phytohabitans rumicis]|uniref:Beta-galactosidase C-terminal domain n=1 Tax=Phytohabitans rumicis TaxID=1076125 RepID=UPI001FE5AC54|nr:Beta-galactosidase C-terminal domain [Phytohabitans rumicis]
MRRSDGHRGYLFVVNHGTHDIEYAVTGQELVTGDAVDGLLRVPAGAVRVVREAVR